MSRILVVDDDSDMRDVVCAYLKAAGYTVDLAHDGEAGVRAAIQEPPDLIVTDIQMPKLDGFGLFNAVRSNPRTAHVPVVILTAHNNRELLLKALRLGVDDFVGKPFNSAELLKAVADRLKPRPAIGRGGRVSGSVATAPGPIRLSAAGSALSKPGRKSVKREVSGSVLFCEVCGFEAFPTVLKRQEVVELLTRFFTEARDIVQQQGGWVVKFMNDRFVAVFDEEGWTHTDRHALRALRGALIVVLAAQRLKSWVGSRFPGRNVPEFAVSLGIHTGPVEVYSQGSATGGATVQGGTVDIAAFLGESSQTLGWSVVASQATAAAAEFAFLPGRGTGLQMIGLEEKVSVVEVKGLEMAKNISPELRKTYALIEAAIDRNAALLASAQAQANAAAMRSQKPIGKTASARRVADTLRLPAMHVDGCSIIRKLAENGIVSVFLVQPQGGGPEEVLKTILIDEDKKRPQLQRLVKEYSAIGLLRHPDIAHTFGQGLTETHAYIVQEYCPGGDLRNVIAERMSPDDAMKTLLRIASGVKAAHEKGVVHGDLKPANVMIRADGSLAITDFSVARIVEYAMGEVGTGVMVSSPDYLSPEQVNGLPADAQSDIYTLGLLLHEMLTGQRPYASPDLSKVLIGHINSPVPQLPATLERFQLLLDRMMAKTRNDRFASVQEAITFMAHSRLAG